MTPVEQNLERTPCRKQRAPARNGTSLLSALRLNVIQSKQGSSKNRGKQCKDT